MPKSICGFTQREAIKEILAAGWLPWYPVENVPLDNNMFWDGEDRTFGCAWGSAITEIISRREPQQLEMFADAE